MHGDTYHFILPILQAYAMTPAAQEPENARLLDKAFAEIARLSGQYQVLSVHKDDMRGQGFNPDLLTDDEMQRIAERMGEGMMESGAYWDALDAACESVPRAAKPE